MAPSWPNEVTPATGESQYVYLSLDSPVGLHQGSKHHGQSWVSHPQTVVVESKVGFVHSTLFYRFISSLHQVIRARKVNSVVMRKCKH